MLSKKIMHKESRAAFIKLYKYSFKKIRNFDEVVNLFLSTDYNHLKHWWMDWRNKMCLKYYSNATNVYPFHDRKFQETTMQFSFLLRLGGLINLFRMPASYKNFFYRKKLIIMILIIFQLKFLNKTILFFLIHMKSLQNYLLKI